jgi:hypothetical protein
MNLCVHLHIFLLFRLLGFMQFPCCLCIAYNFFRKLRERVVLYVLPPFIFGLMSQ